MFGSNYTTDDMLPGLEEQGLRHPKGSNITRRSLGHSTGSFCLQFLELADVLVEGPSQYARRVEDIGLVLRNHHHLLNSLPPHQARATLIHILDSQIERRKQAVAKIRRSWRSLSHQTEAWVRWVFLSGALSFCIQTPSLLSWRTVNSFLL